MKPDTTMEMKNEIEHNDGENRTRTETKLIRLSLLTWKLKWIGWKNVVVPNKIKVPGNRKKRKTGFASTIFDTAMPKPQLPPVFPKQTT